MKGHALSLVVVLSILAIPVFSQTKKTTAKPQNVQTGILDSLDTSAATLILKTRTGAQVTYRLTEKTHVVKNMKTVEPDAFKPGDAIVVRYRKSSFGPPSLYNLADKSSWEWLVKLRKENTLVTIKEITDDTLSGAEASISAPVEYRITEKTAWSKDGKPAMAEDFKAGDRVIVVPRLLPNGNIMATAVSDTPDGAAKLKERSKFTVSGTIKAIDAEKHHINLRSIAGDDRDIPVSPECSVRMASRDVPLAALKPGQLVTVHLARNDEGEQEASKITIQTKKTISRRTVYPKNIRKKPVVVRP